MGVVCWSNAIFSGKSQPSFTGCDADLDSLLKCSTGETEMEMVTRCILGNNTWGKLGQCAADVDIGWSATADNLKLPSSGTQCCWSGGRTRGVVASAHDQAPVDLVSLSRLPSPGWGDRQTGAVLVHTGRSPHNARRVNHQQVY